MQFCVLCVNDDVFSLAKRAQELFATFPEAEIFVLTPSAIQELGASSGFELELLDMAGVGRKAMLEAKNHFLTMAGNCGELTDTRYSGLADAEQFRFVINDDILEALGLARSNVNNAIAAYWGGQYINDFADGSLIRKVYLQAEPAFRSSIEHLGLYHVRNSRAEMVPFTSFVRVDSVPDSPRLTRFQGVPSLRIEGNAAPGKSTGEAMRAVEDLARGLPPGVAMAWTGLSYQEKAAGDKILCLFGISLACVFLCLAALYESWTVPFAILLVVPAGIMGSVFSAWILGQYNDIYFQIAILTLVGLSAKNSILIVTFAKDLQKEGKNLLQATLVATRQRLRPIIMTSLCFVLGVSPLVFAGNRAAQNSLGLAVFSGMITATLLGIFYTPLFFVLLEKLCQKQAKIIR